MGGEILLLERIHDGVVALVLDMRIDNVHQLAVMLVQLLLHVQRLSESHGIPGEVLLAIGVLNVEPDHIVRDVALVELAVDVHDILISNVIPATLVICDRELLWQLRVACQLAVSTDDILRGGSKKHKDVQKSALTDPVRGSGSLSADTEAQWVRC